jgi:hypothetical protein
MTKAEISAREEKPAAEKLSENEARQTRQTRQTFSVALIPPRARSSWAQQVSGQGRVIGVIQLSLTINNVIVAASMLDLFRQGPSARLASPTLVSWNLNMSSRILFDKLDISSWDLLSAIDAKPFGMLAK